MLRLDQALAQAATAACTSDSPAAPLAGAAGATAAGTGAAAVTLGLAAAAGMSFLDAKNFIDEYFRIRPNIRKYIDATIKKAHDEGYVETLFGRRRPTPDVKSSNFIVRSSAERAAANMPIQGTEADLMKMAMLRVDERLDGMGEQLLQIHDSILIECPRENAERVSIMLVEAMEQIYPELGVALQVDVHTGNNWGEV